MGFWETVERLINLLGGLLVPVIAVMTYLIYREQCRIQKATLNLGLFDRRLVVYQIFQKYFGEIQRRGGIDNIATVDFYFQASEVAFLFSGKIVKKREEIYKKGLELALLTSKLGCDEYGVSITPKGPERDEISKNQDHLIKWFQEQVILTKEIFEREIRIDPEETP